MDPSGLQRSPLARQPAGRGQPPGRQAGQPSHPDGVPGTIRQGRRAGRTSTGHSEAAPAGISLCPGRLAAADQPAEDHHQAARTGPGGTHVFGQVATRGTGGPEKERRGNGTWPIPTHTDSHRKTPRFRSPRHRSGGRPDRTTPRQCRPHRRRLGLPPAGPGHSSQGPGARPPDGGQRIRDSLPNGGTGSTPRCPQGLPGRPADSRDRLRCL